MEALYNDAYRNLKYGSHLIKNGQRVKGMSYISFACLEMSLFPGIISNYLHSV